MESDKIMLTPKEAKSILALNRGTAHTFLNAPWGLCGADHSKKSIYEDIDSAEFLEITGEAAQAMGHGLAIMQKGGTKQSDILFVETNMDLVKKLEKKKNGI